MLDSLKSESPALGGARNGAHVMGSAYASGVSRADYTTSRPRGGTETAARKTSSIEALRLLKTLAPDGSPLTFQTFAEAEGSDQRGLAKILHGRLLDHHARLRDLNNQGAGVFITVHETDGRGRKRENITKARALFLDFDTPDPERPAWLVDVCALEPSIIVESSPGKHHVYWAADDLALEEWDRLQRDLCAAFGAEGADLGVKDRARVMRLPGHWHVKGKPFPVQVVYESKKRYSASELREWVASLDPPDSYEIETTAAAGSDTADNVITLPVAGVTLIVARDALAHCPNNDRHYDDWLAVGMALHHQFSGSAEAFELWREWSATSSKVANEDHDFRKWQSFDSRRSGGVSMRGILREAEANGWQRPAGVEGAVAAADDFPLLDTPAETSPRAPLLRPVGELLRDPPRLEWLVSGFIEHPTLVQMFGEPSSGKSFLALDLAASIAAGIEWHGRAVKQAPVVYVAGEGHAGVQRRLKAWEMDRDTPLAGAPLHVSSRAVEFARPAMLKQLQTELDALDTAPALIVIDTLARAAAGMDENSTKEMGAFMSAVEALSRRYGCSVLLVHHTGHGNKERGRGASTILAAIDVCMRLERTPGDVLALQCVKMKDAEPFASCYFELQPVTLPGDWTDSEGEPVRSAVVVESERGAKALPEQPSGKNQRAALDVAKRMLAEQMEIVVDGEGGEAPPLSATEWRERCKAEGLDRSRFREAREGLTAQGFITTGADGLTFSIAHPFPSGA